MSDPGEPASTGTFPFRPWVRRAGLSILAVAAAATLALAGFLGALRGAWNWNDERALWVYIAVLWIGGAKIVVGTRRPVAEVHADWVVLRPLHQLRQRVLAWEAIRGTEQMMGGDRLIVYYDTRRGMRFVALNLNLVKGRRDFLALLDQSLRAHGFIERVVERSRYLTRPEEA